MPTLPYARLHQFVQRVFESCGAPKAEAQIVADHLLTANLVGVDSHGLIRVTQYLDEIRAGSIVPGAPITVLNETETTAVVDGAWNFGMVAALRAMEVGLEKAREHRTACVVTRRCGHAGRLGHYTSYAAERGFFAFGVCNSPRHGHFVLPWGGREARLATNPISYGVPTDFGHPIVADFSTAAAPEGKIRLYRDRGVQVPEGWIVDGEGKATKEPGDFYGPPQGAILPFGGESGYRGYALSLLVEILGGALGGLDITVDQPGNGLAFIVIDLSAFLPMTELLPLIDKVRTYMKSSPPAAGSSGVLLPGEPEYLQAEIRKQTGIPVDDNLWEKTRHCAEALGVAWEPGIKEN